MAAFPFSVICKDELQYSITHNYSYLIHLSCINIHFNFLFEINVILSLKFLFVTALFILAIEISTSCLFCFTMDIGKIILKIDKRTLLLKIRA